MAKKISIVLGIILVLMGLIGFFKNSFIGNGAFFEANAWHNILHIVLGAVLLFVTYSKENALTLTLKIVGIIILIVAILGFLSTKGMDTNIIFQLFTVNEADNWAHLIIGAVLYIFGWKKSVPTTTTNTPANIIK